MRMKLIVSIELFILYSCSCGSQVKMPCHRAVMCVKRDHILHLIVLKVVACLACWCLWKPFPSQNNVWRHWWHSRSQIWHGPSDILLTCTWVCRGLDGPSSTCSECLPEGTCDFEPPEHVPRTSAGAHTCALVFQRALGVPRSPEPEQRPAAGRGKNAEDLVPRKHIYLLFIHLYIVVPGNN